MKALYLIFLAFIPSSSRPDQVTLNSVREGNDYVSIM